MRKVDQQNQA
jgi:hypothetical protein